MKKMATVFFILAADIKTTFVMIFSCFKSLPSSKFQQARKCYILSEFFCGNNDDEFDCTDLKRCDVLIIKMSIRVKVLVCACEKCMLRL